MGTPSPPAPNQPEPHRETNPLGGRVHSGDHRGPPTRRLWSGYVAHIRPCPHCGWENEEHALFCVSCAADIRAVTTIPSMESRAGVAMLQHRLDRDRRRHDRQRSEAVMGGGGWIAFGAIVIVIALVVGMDRTLGAAAWLVAVLSALAGIWQMRRDARAMRIWGTALAGCAVLMLGFVGFRAIQASGETVLPALPSPTVAPTMAAPGLLATPSGTILEGNVPMSGAGATHSGVMPGPAPDTTPILAWQTDLGGEAYGAPTLANGLLYVMSKTGTLYAVDATTGAITWQQEVTPYVTRSSPAVVDGVVYVGGGFTFHAYDAATGAEKWNVPLQYGGQASPTVHDGIVVVASQQGWVYALSAVSGELAWRLPTEGIVFGAAAFGDDAVIYATDEGIVYSVRPDTGTLIWRSRVSGSVFASPVLSDSALYVTSQSGQIHALDLASGDLLWSVDHGGNQSRHWPATPSS